jgi:predicted PurR-regulated permease PerM
MSLIQNANGKIGWILLWALGVPIPILLGLFLIRGCT